MSNSNWLRTGGNSSGLLFSVGVVALAAATVLAGGGRAEAAEPAAAAPAAAPTQAAAAAGQTADKNKKFFKFVDGKLERPTGYREWIYVGTPLTPHHLNPPEAPFPEFHNVYIDPVSWEIYKKTGEFRQETVLIKELVLSGPPQRAASGQGYFMGEFTGLEVAIKSKELFPKEPGNWAYFTYGHKYPLAKTSVAFPAASCNSCHAAAAKQDFVFTQYYPVLRARTTGAVEMGADVTADAEKQKLADAMAKATKDLSIGGSLPKK